MTTGKQNEVGESCLNDPNLREGFESCADKRTVGEAVVISREELMEYIDLGMANTEDFSGVEIELPPVSAQDLVDALQELLKAGTKVRVRAHLSIDLSK